MSEENFFDSCFPYDEVRQDEDYKEFCHTLDDLHELRDEHERTGKETWEDGDNVDIHPLTMVKTKSALQARMNRWKNKSCRKRSVRTKLQNRLDMLETCYEVYEEERGVDLNDEIQAEEHLEQWRMYDDEE